MVLGVSMHNPTCGQHVPSKGNTHGDRAARAAMRFAQQRLRSLRDFTQHLKTRADDSHAPPAPTPHFSGNLKNGVFPLQERRPPSRLTCVAMKLSRAERADWRLPSSASCRRNGSTAPGPPPLASSRCAAHVAARVAALVQNQRPQRGPTPCGISSSAGAQSLKAALMMASPRPSARSAAAAAWRPGTLAPPPGGRCHDRGRKRGRLKERDVLGKDLETDLEHSLPQPAGRQAAGHRAQAGQHGLRSPQRGVLRLVRGARLRRQQGAVEAGMHGGQVQLHVAEFAEIMQGWVLLPCHVAAAAATVSNQASRHGYPQRAGSLQYVDPQLYSGSAPRVLRHRRWS